MNPDEYGDGLRDFVARMDRIDAGFDEAVAQANAQHQLALDQAKTIHRAATRSANVDFMEWRAAQS